MSRLREEHRAQPARHRRGADIGRVVDAEDALDRYLRHVGKAVTTRLDGLTVVVDCAHGAASTAAPRAYRAAGANVIAINAEPDGLNINECCGSTHMESLQSAVVSYGADLGLAHDGDADRCLAVDATGQIIDGDAIMVVLALAMQEAGELASNTLVATVMSNLGLHLAMRSAGIEVRTTGVGDRYVLEELRAGRVLARRRTVRPHRHAGVGHHRRRHPHRAAADVADGADSIHAGRPRRADADAAPGADQRQVADKATVADAPSVRTAVAEAEAELGDTGRILLRPSGTEQVVRVMVEAADEDTARQLAVRVAESVSEQR